MIKIVKSKEVPPSLQKPKPRMGQDVRRQLRADQYSKCYLCDRDRESFQIEHFKSSHNFPLLKYKWTNLFFACDYCNRMKSDDYDDLLNPTVANIEEIICQEIDLDNNQAVFSSPNNDCIAIEVSHTIELLSKIHNGRNGIREKDS